MLLSIGIPVYNERYTLSTILDVVARVFIYRQQDDGTREWLNANFPDEA